MSFKGEQNALEVDQKNSLHIVFITGMHRSGSSALSRAMSTLGIDHSDNLMRASEDNAKGYWEDEDFVTFNDDLLRQTGQLWDEPKLINPEEFIALAESQGTKACSLLKSKAKNKLIILPGSGIRPANTSIFKEAGFEEIHTSASVLIKNKLPFFDNTEHTVSDAETISEIVSIIQNEA